MAAVNGRLCIAFRADDPSHRLIVTSSPDGLDWTSPEPRITIPGIAIGSARFFTTGEITHYGTAQASVRHVWRAQSRGH